MKFESVKCDECKRIQDGANHWVQMRVWTTPEATECVAVALGPFQEHADLRVKNINPESRIEIKTIDLCGQGCAMKHLAKLLGWSQVIEAQQS